MNKYVINDCEACEYYEYVPCAGHDCFHEDAPEKEDRGEEYLAENREGNFPKWCPMMGKVELTEWGKNE